MTDLSESKVLRHAEKHDDISISTKPVSSLKRLEWIRAKMTQCGGIH